MCSKDEEEKEADQHLVVQVLDLVLLLVLVLVQLLVLLILGQPQWLSADLFSYNFLVPIGRSWWLWHQQSD